MLFLMKYETRDDIALLGKGASAVKEMRELISEQQDDSPIYGFIRYRRRNILIKLVPENTSRVLKARSQVHFQSVIERFSPCDVTVSLKSYRELTDAALTTACSTHTATASISSSSSSLRQRRLTDIQETSEEGLESQDPEPKPDSTKVVENQQGLQVIVTTHDPGVSSDGKRAPIEVEISASEPIEVEPDLDDFPAVPETVIDDEGSVAGGEASSFGLTRSHSFAHNPRVSESEGGGRRSTSRPTAEDIYAELALKYQPKVKLGPRPSADWNRRPHTSSSVSSGPTSEKSGPTASVPKNIHLPTRMGTRKARSGSQSSSSSKLQFLERASSPGPASNKGPLRHPGPPPLQFASANIAPPNSFPSAPLSPTPSFASFKSTHSTFSLSTPIGAASAANAGSSTSSLISPEKARLMKALELRKKALSQQSATTHLKPAEELSGPPPQPGAFRSSSPAAPASAAAAAAPPSMIMMASPLAAFSSTASQPSRVSSTDGVAMAAMAAAASVAAGSPPNSSSSSSSISPPSEPASLENSVPDTPTQDSYAATTEPAATAFASASASASATETTVPSPTQAPSTSTERDSQKSFSDDLDKESESSYAVSDLNGDSLESNTITDDGEDRLATRLHPPPPTLLLPTPKASPLEPEPIKKKQTPPPELTPKPYDESKRDRDDTPPRSPLLHLNMLAPKAPADYMESQKLPKAHHRLPSDVPVIETARSVSAPFLINQEKKQALVSSRKVSVSSSVSQRIKALEMLSNKPAAVQAPLTPQRSRPSSPTPQFPPLRANSLKTSASSPNLTPLPGTSTVPALSSITQRVESPFLNKRNADEAVTNGRSNALPPLGSYSASKSRTGSFGEISIIPSRKASVSSLNITTMAEPDPVSTASSSAGTSPTEKKIKMPPLLRRMSSTKSAKKSPTPSIASPLSTPVTPVVKTSPIMKPTSIIPKAAPAAATPAPAPAPAQPVKTTLLTGWVNVQLPDTMLWKRRYIKIESDNWLYLANSADEVSIVFLSKRPCITVMLTISQGSGLTGKYNIRTDVQSAVVPDIDEQELPNSVNLRLREGGVLACACENQQEQHKILKGMSPRSPPITGLC
ncbi:hypothetical protein Dda_2700 [Drechslerella dactyloides]|uniref:ADF-H domain-containing protein n=1 Tax=Drechslerella dactyloides TaxID=74499 RepID=A0AAD6J4B9_DREDA|nr:hypothetical protein Dda_2700 [Drechslerella dactyloides]